MRLVASPPPTPAAPPTKKAQARKAAAKKAGARKPGKKAAAKKPARPKPRRGVLAAARRRVPAPLEPVVRSVARQPLFRRIYRRFTH